MNEMIEKLKKNEKGYRFLSDEETACMGKAQEAGGLVRLSMEGEWESKRQGCNLYVNDIYRISPDYQPEPEIGRCEVFYVKNGHGFDELVFLRRGMEQGIEMALRLTDFIGYEYKSGTISVQPRLYANRADTAPVPDYVLFKK